MSRPRKTLNIDEMAAELGVTRQAIGRYTKAGMPHGGAGKKHDPYTYDAEACLAWVDANRSGIQGSTVTADVAPATSSDDAGKIVKFTRIVNLEIKKLEAARRKRLERIAEGELHDRAECERGRLQRIATVRSGLLALPGKLSARLAGREPHEIDAEVTREVTHLLAQFSGRTTEATEATTG